MKPGETDKTKLLDVEGMTFHIPPDPTVKPKMAFATITVRVTRDDDGKSLCLSDEKRGIMLEIPLEPVEKWLGVTI